MSFIIFLFIIFIGGGWLIGHLLGRAFFPKSNDEVSHASFKDSKTTIHNHVTHNHLHVTKEDLNSLIDKPND